MTLENFVKTTGIAPRRKLVDKPLSPGGVEAKPSRALPSHQHLPHGDAGMATADANCLYVPLFYPLFCPSARSDHLPEVQNNAIPVSVTEIMIT